MPTITAIIPTLNEEQNVRPLLTRLEEIRSPQLSFKVLFVDDSSTDGTVDAILNWHDSS